MSIRDWILGNLPQRVAKLEDNAADQDTVLGGLTGEWMDLERTFQAQLDRARALTEEIDERIDRGNKIWRAIRARERRQEVDEEIDDPQQLHLLDGEGSGSEGVPALPDNLAGARNAVPPHKEIARQIAHQLLGGKGPQ